MPVCMHTRPMYVYTHVHTCVHMRTSVCLGMPVCMCTEAANPAGAVSHLLSKEWLSPVMAVLMGVRLMH